MYIDRVISELISIKKEMKAKGYEEIYVKPQADSGPDGRPFDLRLCVCAEENGKEVKSEHIYCESYKGKPWPNWDKIKNAPKKKYQVGIYHKCPNCGHADKPHGCRWTNGTFSYIARSPEEAAWKTHQWLCSGGPYGDLCWAGWQRDFIFRVKETGTPKNEGITWVDQASMLPE